MCDCCLSRRSLARAATLGAATTMAAPLAFRPAHAGGTRTKVIRGRFEPGTAPDWHYVPVDVPSGVRVLRVSYDYNRTPTAPGGLYGNVLDIGIFDTAGFEPGQTRGFRGWSGGARERFRIGRGSATPGYLAGPIPAGRWHVQLGPYSVAPEGMDWTVTVELEFGRPEPRFVPRPAPRRIPGAGAGWYRGDLHLHTVHSDGRRSRAELVREARRAGLDFMVSTEHNNQSASLHWGKHATRDLLIIDGEEVTTRSGHWIAAGLPAGAWIDWRYRASEPEMLRRFVDQVHGLGGLAIVAHPHAPFSGTRWEFDYTGIDAVELMNGPWTLDDEFTLQWWHARLVAGKFLPAVGSSDAHTPDHAVGTAQTVVRASSLSRGAILEGVRRGRAWLAESSAVSLRFRAGGPGRWVTCGERVREPSGEDTVQLRVRGVPGCVGVIRSDALVLAVGAADEHGVIRLEAPLPPGQGFVRAEVRRPSDDVPLDPTQGAPGGDVVAITNPVFLT